MNQCVYFAFRTIVLFGVLFSNEHFFFTIKFEEIRSFENALILLDFVFRLENLPKFQSYQNMLTLSSLIFYVISYKFSLNDIYITSHLHVEKGS
jgi:hypothetical protein